MQAILSGRAVGTGRSAAAKFAADLQISRQLPCYAHRIAMDLARVDARGQLDAAAQLCEGFRLGGSAILTMGLTVILDGQNGVCARRLGSLLSRQPSSAPLPSIAKHPIAGKARAQNTKRHQTPETREDYKNHVKN